jgi:hypothetical protein
MSQGQVKVLYIGGYGRSGSTLFQRMLGRVDGCVAVGELWYIWDRGMAENQLCGCGKPFRECEFWNAIIQRAFGGMSQVDVEAMRKLSGFLHDDRQIPPLVLPAWRSAHYQARLAAYADVLRRLYGAIQQVSGCRTIVDSSKAPRYAFVLNEIDELKLDVIHLTRDSRAAAYSWQRQKRRPEIHWANQSMDQNGPAKSAIQWNLTNGLLHWLKQTRAGYLRVRYEDLVARPRETLLRVGKHLGADWSQVNFLSDGNTVHLGLDHTVSGNPNRFQRGAIEIRPDTEWQVKMPRRQKYAVTALTLPLLLKYDYL